MLPPNLAPKVGYQAIRRANLALRRFQHLIGRHRRTFLRSPAPICTISSANEYSPAREKPTAAVQLDEFPVLDAHFEAHWGRVEVGRNLVRGLAQKCQCHERIEGEGEYDTALVFGQRQQLLAHVLSPMEFPWNWNPHVISYVPTAFICFITSWSYSKCAIDRIRDHITSPSLCSALRSQRPASLMPAAANRELDKKVHGRTGKLRVFRAS